MATGDVALSEGSGKNAATFTFTEDAKTKFAQRVVACNSSGAELTAFPVTAASLPLPSGAATSAKQDTANTALAAIQAVAESATPSPVAHATGLMTDSAGASLTPKFAAISTSSSGAQSLVAAVTGKKIRVLGLSIMSAGTTNVKFASATAGDKTGLYPLNANGGFILPYSPVGHFETASGEALQINNSAAIQVGGCLTYVEV